MRGNERTEAAAATAYVRRNIDPPFMPAIKHAAGRHEKPGRDEKPRYLADGRSA